MTFQFNNSTGKLKLKLPGVIHKAACCSKTRQNDGRDGFPLFSSSKVWECSWQKTQSPLVFNLDQGADNKALSKDLKLLLQGKRWKLHNASRGRANRALNVINNISNLTLKGSGSQLKHDEMGVTCLITSCSRHGCCFTSFLKVRGNEAEKLYWTALLCIFQKHFNWRSCLPHIKANVAKCLLPAFFLIASRGRLFWFQN